MREMKESGIDSVGLIPKCWNSKRLKYVCEVETGNEDTQNANSYGKFPFYVRSPIIERCDKYTFDGDGILIAGDGAGAGRIFHFAQGKYAVHQRVYRLSQFKYYAKFLYYYLSSVFPYEMDKGSAQSTVPSMRLPMLMNFEFVLPPEKEAILIINYLENKCAEIDALHADIEKEIDILKRYKQSVITEAVTKGLDPDVEMKDSGIEWIGEIPSTWYCEKMKYVISEPLQYGANEAGDDYIEDYPRYIRITDITEEKLLKDDGKLFLKPHIAKPYLLKDGDLLFARSGATVGKTFYYSSNYGTCAFAGYLIKARFNKDKMNPKFAYYTTLGIGYECWKNTVFTQSTIQNIGADKYAKLYITVPSVKEQNEIIEYLDVECKTIDDVIHKKKQQISTIQQYKKSLIYEYVTGKKEVPSNV